MKLGIGILAGAIILGTMGSANAADPAKGQRVFNRCKVCHSVNEGQNGLGPSLHGLIGRTSGTAEGFKFSDAMTEKGVVWTAETLTEFLQNPRAFVPGTIMAFGGLRNEQQLADLIAYLEEASAAE